MYAHVYRVHVCLCELGGVCQTAGLGLSQSHSVVCWCLVSKEKREKNLLPIPYPALVFKQLEACQNL